MKKYSYSLVAPITIEKMKRKQTTLEEKKTMANGRPRSNILSGFK
jgi:hypothetical protein